MVFRYYLRVVYSKLPAISNSKECQFESLNNLTVYTSILSLGYTSHTSCLITIQWQFDSLINKISPRKVRINYSSKLARYAGSPIGIS